VRFSCAASWIEEPLGMVRDEVFGILDGLKSSRQIRLRADGTKPFCHVTDRNAPIAATIAGIGKVLGKPAQFVASPRV
jgi:hypothetical protein